MLGSTALSDGNMDRNMNLTRFLLIVLMLDTTATRAADVPAMLPDPDGKPGSSEKPVRVYILAGQSNMVGMGNLSGATNVYDGVYLSSDPAIPDGPLQIYKAGNFRTGRLRICTPDGDPTTEPVSKGLLEVLVHGTYRFHSADSMSQLTVDGQPAFVRRADGATTTRDLPLVSGRKYQFAISGFNGTPPRIWAQKTDLLGNGDLDAVAKRDGKFPWLVDEDGEWTVRHDVYFQEARLAKDGRGSLLSPTSNNGKSIGPELGFGHVMGTFHDEQVLLIKTAQGNRSLGFDFRPPSSGRSDPDNKFESLEYRLMLEGVRRTLSNIKEVVPGYSDQGYEIAGFVWFQGHKDSFAEQSISEYEQHLVNLINDLRKDLEAPGLPVVVATVGFGGRNMQDKFVRILNAQMAVSDVTKYPEYKGTVTSVDTRPYWRDVVSSPKSEDYHYNRNAETYLRIGDALGRAMVRLEGGTAESLPAPAVAESSPFQQAGQMTKAQKAAEQNALRPVILGGIAMSYLKNPRYNAALQQEALGERPQRPNQFLRGTMYGLINCYRAAGITDYDWKQFGPDLDNANWDYFSFDPVETLPKDKGNRYRSVTVPKGMEQWSDVDFEARGRGWMSGRQPFGQLDGIPAPLSESCTAPFCRCGEKPNTLWEKEVLMIRTTVKLPPLKDGHRYRVVLGGAAHVNSGEGFLITLNGRQLAESKSGVAVRQGGQPRGGHIYTDLRDVFDGGDVTIAAVSFLRYNHPRRGIQPPRGHLSLRIEEQKLPPAVGGQTAAAR